MVFAFVVKTDVLLDLLSGSELGLHHASELLIVTCSKVRLNILPFVEKSLIVGPRIRRLLKIKLSIFITAANY